MRGAECRRITSVPPTAQAGQRSPDVRRPRQLSPPGPAITRTQFEQGSSRVGSASATLVELCLFDHPESVSERVQLTALQRIRLFGHYGLLQRIRLLGHYGNQPTRNSDSVPPSDFDTSRTDSRLCCKPWRPEYPARDGDSTRVHTPRRLELPCRSRWGRDCHSHDPLHLERTLHRFLGRRSGLA
jgi:hypothetical protein